MYFVFLSEIILEVCQADVFASISSPLSDYFQYIKAFPAVVGF